MHSACSKCGKLCLKSMGHLALDAWHLAVLQSQAVLV